ncbi:GNAT family N-acetyltransferase [Nonomuraea muscovyensis]|uniref:RimJ/RimL family protein N-acetyltransferase n=1 Tax=Nonomuraea muscovyensis TaxID=1124761 RepID=A0A7X0F0Z4_9ACTN|nr:GNAT family N-acetyltransferase [Nonomuraea muscovyensis]MBB6348350.1 RimJ/RimL family protein N-acetyltransferase [Nonomuraea muscovyensis]
MLPRDVIAAGPLVLRPPVEADAEAIVTACDDPVAAGWLALPSPYTPDDARAHLAAAEARWRAGGAEYAITEGGVRVGSVGVTPPDRWGAVSMGYLVAPGARGRGVATTAARAVTQWLFDQGVHRVELQVAVENVASLLVAYRAGFHEEGRRREAKVARDGRRVDAIVLSRLAGEPGEGAPPYLPPFEGGELTDGVVRLTPLAVSDAADYHTMMADPSVAVYRLGPRTTLEDDERRCRNTGYWWASGQRVELAIRDAGSDVFTGHLQLMQVVPALGQAMVGYSLRPEFRGKGLMTRAVRLLVDWAFARTTLHRIVAGTDATNTASHAVLHRAGFVRECVHRELFPTADGSRSDDMQWVRLRPR